MVTKATKPAASKTTAAKAPVSKKVATAKKAVPAPAKTPAVASKAAPKKPVNRGDLSENNLPTEAELLKKFRHSSAFGLGGARPVPLRRPGHQDDFTGRDRKIPVDGFDLGNVGDPQITAAAHRAPGWPKISEYQAQKRGLPRPGWAYDPEERRLLDDQVDMIEHERAAVGV